VLGEYYELWRQPPSAKGLVSTSRRSPLVAILEAGPPREQDGRFPCAGNLADQTIAGRGRATSAARASCNADKETASSAQRSGNQAAAAARSRAYNRDHVITP